MTLQTYGICLAALWALVGGFMGSYVTAHDGFPWWSIFVYLVAGFLTAALGDAVRPDNERK